MLSSNRSPRVLAVVLNWCAENDSAACVSSLNADDSAATDVLIVDNASPDGSGARLHERFPDTPFLQTGANLGYAGGNQRAIEWALARDYDYVLIINDDAEVQRGCVGALVNALERNSKAGAAAPTILHHGTSIVWFAGGELSEFKLMGFHSQFGETIGEPSEGTAVREVSFLTGCVLMLRAETLRQLDGFREEFFAYVEDLELSLRYRRQGKTLLHVPSARATHKVPFPPNPDGAFAIRLRDVNRRRTAKIHFGFAEQLSFALWFYPTRLIHLIRFVVKGDSARTKAIWNGMVERV